MKNKIIFTLVVGLLATGACNKDNLDIAPGQPAESTFFKNELDFDKLVLGVYAKMTEMYNYRGEPLQTQSSMNLPGDDITTLNAVSWAGPFEIFATLDATNGTVAEYFATMYRIVSRANIALEKIGEEQGVYRTPGLKNTHRGEALFMRGLAYFHLANNYGTSPLITERITGPENAYFPSVTEGALLDQAIKDFGEAAQLLPETWNAVNLGRATKNAANGMLGKCLVFRGTIKKAQADFTQAIAAFDAIKGRTLTADIMDNFDALKENNSESLFEFQASTPGANDNVYVANGDDFQAAGVGSTSAYWGNYEPRNPLLFGKANFVVTRKLVAAYERNDPRRWIFVDTTNTARNLRKYWTKDVKTNNNGSSMNNPRILRFADVLLLRAEAIVQSGGSIATAMESVNQVRARARAQRTGGTVPANIDAAGLTRDQAMEIIRNERFLELVGEEGHRWYDLKRWHRGGQIDLARWDFSSDNTNFKFDVGRHLWWPIPQREVDNNPQVRQNPGW